MCAGQEANMVGNKEKKGLGIASARLKLSKDKKKHLSLIYATQFKPDRISLAKKIKAWPALAVFFIAIQDLHKTHISKLIWGQSPCQKGLI